MRIRNYSSTKPICVNGRLKLVKVAPKVDSVEVKLYPFDLIILPMIEKVETRKLHSQVISNKI